MSVYNFDTRLEVLRKTTKTAITIASVPVEIRTMFLSHKSQVRYIWATLLDGVSIKKCKQKLKIGEHDDVVNKGLEYDDEVGDSMEEPRMLAIALN